MEATLKLRGPDDVAALAFRCLDDRGWTGVLVLALDVGRQLVGVAVHAEIHTVDGLDPEHLQLIAEEVEASALVVVLVRPDSDSMPSVTDDDAWRELAQCCRAAEVRLLDVVVVSGHRWWSLAERVRPLLGDGKSRRHRSDL